MAVVISSERKLIVLHTPKCGGSSLKKSLTDGFGRHAIYADYKYIKGERISRSTTIDKPIIYGHFPAKRYEDQRDAYWVTLLRHPVDRMLSLYFNWRYSSTKELKNPIGPLRQRVRNNDIGLLEFARQPIGSRLATHYFAQFDMTRMNLIITHEHYNAGVATLGAALGVDLKVAHANVSSSRSEAYNRARKRIQADNDVMAELHSILRTDIEFYEDAMRLPSVVRSAPPSAQQKPSTTLMETRMRKYSSALETLAKRSAARRLAGNEWKELDKSERQARIKAAHNEVSNIDKQRAVVSLAKNLAKESGSNWAELSKEKRREFQIQVRRAR